MRKSNPILLLAYLLSLFISSSTAQKSIEGHWEGTMIREMAALTVSFDFTNEAEKLKASFNSPTQRTIGLPLRNVSYNARKIHFELVGDATTIVFDRKLTANRISGQFRKNEAHSL